MNNDRRSFFGKLAATVAGAVALVAANPVEAAPEPPKLTNMPAPPVKDLKPGPIYSSEPKVPHWLRGQTGIIGDCIEFKHELKWLTYWIVQELERLLPPTTELVGRCHDMKQASVMCDLTRQMVMFQRPLTVDGGQSEAKHLARMLSDHIFAKGMSRFAELPLVRGFEQQQICSKRGISVRGTRQFDVREDVWFYRFDVLGA